MHLNVKDILDARTAQYEQVRDQLALERQLHATHPTLRATLATRLRRLADQLDRPAAPACC